MLPRVILTLLLSAVVAGGALTAVAHASGPQIGVTDDRILLAGGPKADKAVAEWKADGVDVVRIFALWSRYAPSPNSKKAPKKFNAADPNASGYNWFYLDQEIDRVRAAGMKVMLTVSGPAPRWAQSKTSKTTGTWQPSPKAFADYAHAVATRYGSVVDTYVLWNEPNSGTFLLPQTTGKGKKATIASAAAYRSLVNAAYPAIKASDHGAQILIGALAPKARTSRFGTSAPLAFLRAFGCVNASLHKIRAGACKHYAPPHADGFALHPYGAKTPPEAAPKHSDDINIATLGRIETTLDKLHHLKRYKGPSKLGLWLDEFGYQTRPPDRISGVPLGTQDRWDQEGAYLAWRDHRVRLLTQYLWYDEPKVNGGYANWQSGLRYASGGAKPSLAHFAVPFMVDTSRRLLWGQARPGAGRQKVTVQIKPHGRGWHTIKTLRTDSLGYWTLKQHSLSRTSLYRFKTGKLTSSAVAG